LSLLLPLPLLFFFLESAAKLLAVARLLMVVVWCWLRRCRSDFSPVAIATVISEPGRARGLRAAAAVLQRCCVLQCCVLQGGCDWRRGCRT
jgi:hypothetical protein